MKKIVLNAKDRSYDIYCGSNIYGQIGGYFDLAADKICIITDSNVAPLYLRKIKNAVNADVYDYVFEAGESSKTIDTCAKIYNFLAQKGFSKTDILIALGGGVCGDITGFVASTYLRGIRYYGIPTTLLAQVDSSIGGKCGVDISGGKNLVGSIYQPFGVLIDTLFLNTLDEGVFNDGMAEVIKYGFIYDKSLYQKCVEDTLGNLSDIIFRCVQIKKEIVEKDEFDGGLRMILNFGHTIGHAIEKLGGYEKHTHGSAVSIGMAYAAKLSEITYSKTGLFDSVAGSLKKLNLPVETDYSYTDIAQAVLNDKKNRDGLLNFILLKEIGKAEIYKINTVKVADFIRQAF
jgi:3-dehydroquinate synthase